jgi:hypothetical protein
MLLSLAQWNKMPLTSANMTYLEIILHIIYGWNRCLPQRHYRKPHRKLSHKEIR